MKEQNEIKVKRVAASEQAGRGMSRVGAAASVRALKTTICAAALARLLPATENKKPDDERIRRKSYARRALVYLVCMVVYILLDRSAVFLQMWPNISAWYPPVGFAVALLIGLGPEILPLLTFSSYLSGIINYHKGFAEVGFMLTTLLFPIVYGTASLFLCRRLPRGFSTPQHSRRDESFGDYAVRGFGDCLGRYASSDLGRRYSPGRLSARRLQLVGRGRRCARQPDPVSAAVCIAGPAAVLEGRENRVCFGPQPMGV